MTQGIYLIENLINHKKYIGQSTHIEIRWHTHKNYYKDHFINCPLLYQAFEKYGIQNFQFTILEIINDKKLLDEKETQYIIQLNTLAPNGYNCVLPVNMMRGENNIKNKLTSEQITHIKDQLQQTNIPIQTLATEYGVAWSTIYRINKGEIWTMPNESYPIRKNNQLGRSGSQNGMAIFTEEEVYEIRLKYVDHTINELYQQYKDRCSLSGFKKIIQGTTFKNVPIYKKSIKTWIM